VKLRFDPYPSWCDNAAKNSDAHGSALLRKSARLNRPRSVGGSVHDTVACAGSWRLCFPGCDGSRQAVTISLDEAIRRAEASEPSYAAALRKANPRRLTAPSRARACYPVSPFTIRRSTPSQWPAELGRAGRGPAAIARFIANNAVREYASQAVVNETLGLGQMAQVRRADAASALAAAELEIARRGLVAAVTSLYYGLAAAENKLSNFERASQEAAAFSTLTTQREQAREAAHADVVKAQLEQQQRERDLSDARLSAVKARLELAVLLFPDPHTPYALAIADAVEPLASRAEVDQAAATHNAELKSALGALGVSNADVLAARAAYLPDLGLNVTYGIDAPQVAVNGQTTCATWAIRPASPSIFRCGTGSPPSTR